MGYSPRSSPWVRRPGALYVRDSRCWQSPQLIEQRSQADAQKIRGLAAVAVGGFERTLNRSTLDCFDLSLEIEYHAGSAGSRAGIAGSERKILRVQKPTCGEYCSTLHGIPELAYVA